MRPSRFISSTPLIAGLLTGLLFAILVGPLNAADSAQRLYACLSLEELETCASVGAFPDPIPNRASSLDTLDRKSLLKLWEEDERVFRGRSHADREYFADTGSWPERTGRLHYSMKEI